MSHFIPRLVSWNLTRRCNLGCAHCYLDAGARASELGELTSEEGQQFIDQLVDLCPGAMLVFTGGEPLLREDLNDLIFYAASAGLLPVLGTNGVLMTHDRARHLAESGLVGVGISLDSLIPEQHDTFRGMKGAWRRTVESIAICKRYRLAVQIHITATNANYYEIPDLIDFAVSQGVVAFHLFFLVCTGRGQHMTDITPSQYEAALSSLVAKQDEYRDRIMIRARCAPHFRRLVSAHIVELAASTAGCMAGITYCRVTPEGEVTPCPYMPLVAGNLRNDSLAHIWETAPIFHQLRQPELQGRCGGCEFSSLCGGCRARAYAVNGSLMAEDPWCEYQPGNGYSPSIVSLMEKSNNTPIEWSAEARDRLGRVPYALRPMIEKGVEAYARTKGWTTITPSVMADMRSKVGKITGIKQANHSH